MVNLLVYYVQWRTKILGTIIKTFLPALTYQVCKCSIISTFAIALPNSPPLDPRNDAGKVYRVAQNTTLLGDEGGREAV